MIPSASVSTATAVKPGFFSNWRKAKRRSFIFGFTIYDLRFTRWQIANPKHQAPEKSQAPNSNDGRPASVLELEIWGFLGIWCLELSLIPLDNDEIRKKPEARNPNKAPVAR